MGTAEGGANSADDTLEVLEKEERCRWAENGGEYTAISEAWSEHTLASDMSFSATNNSSS